MSLRISASYSDKTVGYSEKPTATTPKDVGLRVPNEGDFAFIVHDFDIQLLSEFHLKPRQYLPSYEQKKPMPATRQLWGCQKLRYSDFIPLAKDWQFFLYDLLGWAIDYKIPEGSMSDVGTQKWAYADFIADHRAFTDQHAPDTEDRLFADYVLGRNLNNPVPYMFKCLVTTGNIVRRITPPSSMTNAQMGMNYPIEALDLSKPAPSLQWVLTHKPYLIHWATEQGISQLPDGRYTVARFPQLKVAARKFGLSEVGTPYPLVSWGGWNMIRKSDVRRVGNGYKYSPYVMEKF